jgi:PadR family transcriptional regulator PadR
MQVGRPTVSLENWKVQIKKGYLELCLLLLIQRHERLYGLQLLEKLAQLEMPLKEGTLYPMLNRLTEEGLLKSLWETVNLKGHPRKFYALTAKGLRALNDMEAEFNKMVAIITTLQKGLRQ